MTNGFIWTVKIMKDDEGNVEKDEQTRECNCQLNNVSRFESHRFIVQNLGNNFEIERETKKKNDSENPRQGLVDFQWVHH